MLAIGRRLIGLNLALIALLAVGATAGSVLAVSSAHGWSLKAKYSGQTTLPHEHYHYAVLPGGSVQDAVILDNFDPFPHTIDVYGADMEEAQGGGLAPAQQDQQMHGVGLWLAVSHHTITIPPGQEVQDPFTIKLPQQVVPGDYVGAMVAEDTAPVQSGGVSVSARAALLVEVTVPGSAHPAATLTPLVAHPSGDNSNQFTISATNTGNVLLSVTGFITVTDTNGNLIHQIAINPGDAYAIPGGTLDLTTAAYGFPKGTFTVQAQLVASYRDANDKPVQLALNSNSLSFTFVDWARIGTEIGLGVVLLLLLAYLARKLVRAERQRRHMRLEQERVRQLKEEVPGRLRSL